MLLVMPNGSAIILTSSMTVMIGLPGYTAMLQQSV